MRLLLAVFIFLITYGSLFPFHIDTTSYDPLLLDGLLHFDLTATGRGDLLANILLFIPFGLLGINAFRFQSATTRLFWVLVAGFALAFVLQAAQLALPGREPAGSDAIWNLAGCAIGCAIGSSPLDRYLQRFIGTATYPPIPVVLALLWLVFRLAPFVPSIDLQLLKDNIKALFDHTPSPVWVLQNLTMWLIVFHFLRKSTSRFLAEKHYPTIVAVTLLASFFIIGNNVSVEKIAGGVAALVVWALFRKSCSPALLAVALFITILGINFTPFALLDTPIEFNWIPFSSSLGGNMVLNTLAVFKKLVLYGSLIWLLVECRITLRAATLCTALYLFVSEYAQIFFFSTSPDITDPLLAIAIGITFHQYQARVEQTLPSPDARSSSSTMAPPTPAEAPIANRAVSASYIPGMDGLRAIAALAVFFVHFNQQAGLQAVVEPFDLARLLTNGNTGVALFFVLSGLLLSIPFWEAKLGQRHVPDISSYAWRRAARILPAYYLCLFTIVAAMTVAVSAPGWNNILSHVFFVFNLSDDTILALNQPFWTLAVEVQFYVILPLLFLALRKTSAKAATIIVLLLIPIIYVANHSIVTLIREHATFPVHQLLIWPLSLYLSSPDSSVLTYSTLGHLPHFLIGVVTARLFLHLSGRTDLDTRNFGRFDAVFWIGGIAVFLILATPLDDVLQVPHGRYNFPFVPLLLGAIVVSVPFSRTARAVLTLRLVGWLGAISYGIYIYHYPILKVINTAMTWREFPATEHIAIFAAASLGATLLCAQVSYTLVELPAMRLIRRYLNRNKRPSLSNSNASDPVTESPRPAGIAPIAVEQTPGTTHAAVAQPPMPARIVPIAFEQVPEATPVATAPLPEPDHGDRKNIEINLHQYQYDYLQSRATAAGQSISAVCAALVALNGGGAHNKEHAVSLLNCGANFSVNRGAIGWVTATVALDSSALGTLGELTAKTLQSPSSALRQLIESHIKQQNSWNFKLKRLISKLSFRLQFMRKHLAVGALSMLLVAGALAWFGSTTPSGPSIVVSPDWAGRDTHIIFDHHAHTGYSDGSLTPAELVELGTQNGCNAMAITDHTATPGSASADELEDIQLLRLQYPDLLLLAGIELNMPSYGGREHVGVIVPPELESSVLRHLGDVAELSIREAAEKKSANASDTPTLELMRQLQKESNNLIVTYHHPSRKVPEVNESLEDLLRWDKKNELFTAMEGAPGHQKTVDIGAYQASIVPEDGWDPVVAQVGGVWDQLLDSGYTIWGALASSDYHNQDVDWPPCAFARNHVAVGEGGYSGLIRALKAGTFWADHGRILDQLHFSIELEGLRRPLYPGSVARLGASKGTALATISVERGPGSIGAPLTTEIISNCGSGRTEIVHTSVIPADLNQDTAFLPVHATGSDGRSCFMRARIRFHNPPLPDLLAYTNPIRIML